MTGKNNQRAATKKHAQNAKKREISGSCAFDSEGIAGEEKKVRIEVGIIEEYSVLDCAARLRDVLSRKELFAGIRQKCRSPAPRKTDPADGGETVR